MYVAGAGVEHRHRATTSRYYSPQQLETILEVNYLKFLARSVWSPALFYRLWAQAVQRLRLRSTHYAAARQALQNAASIALTGGPALVPKLSEELSLALTNGTVFVFPGRPATGKPLVLVASDALEAIHRDDRDQIVVAFTNTATATSADNLANYVEIVLVRRSPSAALSFQAALQMSLQKWRPQTVELDDATTGYGPDSAPMRTFVV